MSDFTFTPLRRVAARVAQHDWAWARENAAAIDRNWQRRLSERPGLFDGPVLLNQGCTVRDGSCEATFFETRYSRFIAFRDAGSPDSTVANAFAAIVPRTSDGAVLLGEMGAHTANGGQIYFPCGTPDRNDVDGNGCVDLAGSAARELEEETGLRLPSDSEDAAWMLVRRSDLCAFLRPVGFPETADALLARFAAHRAQEAEPELSRLVVARGRADIDHERMPAFVRAYLGHAFAA